MSKRNIDRVEIVQSNAEQPWSVRIFRNRETFRSSENYTRKVGAQRGLLGLAKAFGWQLPQLEVRPDGTTVLVDAAQMAGLRPWLPVHYLRELDQV